jgi:enamine deaminase RidA (YjgF/YER057c/UK114 family)
MAQRTPPRIEAQTRQVLDNLKAVVEAAGMTMDDVVSTSVFLADLDQFGAMNEVYTTYFGDAPPSPRHRRGRPPTPRRGDRDLGDRGTVAGQKWFVKHAHSG